jgi:hypothetical protein
MTLFSRKFISRTTSLSEALSASKVLQIIAPMENGTRTHYIFVDYENVQALDLDLIKDKPVKVFLVVGPRQKSLPYALTKQIHNYHAQVQMLESESAAKNALDMVLAYHMGVQAKTDPEGGYHVLAKDKDYDALIKHLRAQGIRASRDEEFAKVSALMDPTDLSLAERVKWAADRIAKNKQSRPARKKTLLAQIHALFRKRLPDAEVEQIVARMISQKLIELTPPDRVTYRI